MNARHKSPVVQQWIEKAENDLRNATIVVREEDPPADTICFHCHQVAEKYLKAYLIAKNIEFKKVHDLKYLLNECVKINNSFNNLNEIAETLNSYYIESRYPLDLPIYYSAEEVRKAVDLVHEFRNFVSNKISE